MSPDKKDPSESSNNWITPAVITAVIGLIGTLATVYFGYLQATRPFDLAATGTAEARSFEATAAARIPSQSPATLTATASVTLPAPTPDLSGPTPSATTTPIIITIIPTSIPTRTAGPDEMGFCINSRNINVRLGPGTEYAPVGVLTFSDCLYFDGRIFDDSWLRISRNQPQYAALGGNWVRSNLVRPQDFAQLPIIIPPTSTATPEG
jgi:hypothetical protein